MGRTLHLGFVGIEKRRNNHPQQECLMHASGSALESTCSTVHAQQHALGSVQPTTDTQQCAHPKRMPPGACASHVCAPAQQCTYACSHPRHRPMSSCILDVRPGVHVSQACTQESQKAQGIDSASTLQCFGKNLGESIITPHSLIT